MPPTLSGRGHIKNKLIHYAGADLERGGGSGPPFRITFQDFWHHQGYFCMQIKKKTSGSLRSAVFNLNRFIVHLCSFTTIFDNSANCLENFKVVHRIPYASVQNKHIPIHPNLTETHTYLQITSKSFL